MPIYYANYRTFTDANILRVDVSTTGWMGGDAGHGGVTTVKLTDEASTAWKVSVERDSTDDGMTITTDDPRSITITVQGDAELRTLADSLGWASRKILEIAGESNDGGY